VSRSEYPYPPLVPEDPSTLAARVAASLGRAWDDVQRRYQQVLTSANDLRRAETLATLTELRESVEAFQAKTEASAARLRDRDIPVQYAQGAQRAGVPFRWTQVHEEAASLLAADSYNDLLARSQEAGRTSERFARAIRQAARDPAAFTATGRYTSVQAGRLLSERLSAQGLSVVTYANGAQVPMGAYSQMTVRTKAAVAQNTGALNRYSELGVRYVEVFDGAQCGLSRHDDPDRPNGTVRPIAEMAANLLSHPQCRRSLGARPDITSDLDARLAEPSTTAEQRLDQAASEQAQARRPARRVDAAARRQQLQERRARRTQV